MWINDGTIQGCIRRSVIPIFSTHRWSVPEGYVQGENVSGGSDGWLAVGTDGPRCCECVQLVCSEAISLVSTELSHQNQRVFYE